MAKKNHYGGKKIGRTYALNDSDSMASSKEEEGEAHAADESGNDSTATEDEIAQLEEVSDPELAEELAMAVTRKLEARHQVKKYKKTYQQAKAYVKDIKKRRPFFKKKVHQGGNAIALVLSLIHISEPTRPY